MKKQINFYQSLPAWLSELSTPQLSAILDLTQMQQANVVTFENGFASRFSFDRVKGTFVADPSARLVQVTEVVEWQICVGALPGALSDARNQTVCADQLHQEMPGAILCVPFTDDVGSPVAALSLASDAPQKSLCMEDLRILERYVMRGAIPPAPIDPSGEIRDRISNMMVRKEHDILLQPIVRAGNGVAVGYEALSRFHQTSGGSPLKWFEDAADAGLQVQLETWVIAEALPLLGSLPRDVYLSVNASPATVASGVLTDLLDATQPERIVVELTDFASTDNPEELDAGLQSLRDTGARIAIDDVTANYRDLANVARIKPDIIKLDRELVGALHDDVASNSLIQAIVHFSKDIGATLIAEGVESERELAAVTDLGIDIVQGFLFSRPVTPVQIGLA